MIVERSEERIVGGPTDLGISKTADPAESKKLAGEEPLYETRRFKTVRTMGRQTTEDETSDTVNDFMTVAGNYAVLILGCKHPAPVAHHGSSSFM